VDPCRVGLSLSAARHDPPEQVLPRVAEVGIGAVELHMTEAWIGNPDPAYLHRLARLCARCGIIPWSVHTQYGPQADVGARNEEWRKEGVRLVAQGARALWEVGGTLAVLHPSGAVEDRERAAVVAAVRHSLQDLLEATASFPVLLAVENMLPGQGGDRTQELADMMRGLPDRVCLCLDTGHASLTPEGVELAKPLASRLAWLHLQDNMGDGDGHLPPFSGKLDWRGVARVLEAADYRGVYMFEISNATTEPSLPALAGLAQRLEDLRREVRADGS